MLAKKLILTSLTLGLFLSCSYNKNAKQIGNKQCIVVNNLVGKQYLDSTYLQAIESIEINTQLSNSTTGMVWIEGGSFIMGGNIPKGFENMPATALAQNDEYPNHKVQVTGFYMDEHEVTVGQYLKFVEATGYKTVAEKDINWQQLKKQLPPNTPKPNENMLKAGSLVFQYVAEGTSKNNIGNWWKYTTGVDWKNPDGTNPKLEEILQQPVTQVSWYDALAYAKWCGKRLPTEAEFEYAMRGGVKKNMYPWGNEKTAANKHYGNFFQGNFPYNNTADDGFLGVAPIKQFPPNAYGLYDIAGNVWEWTADWYSPLYYAELMETDVLNTNPKGPIKSYEINNKYATNKVIRGGSFLCNDSWCSGYRNARRMRLSPDTGMQHLGFRLVKGKNK